MKKPTKTSEPPKAVEQDELEQRKDFDPLEEDRVYVRNIVNGNLGWLVRRDGREMVRLDRPMEEILFPMVRLPDGEPKDWAQESRPRAIGPGVAARIAFEAHRALCAALGKHMKAKAEWLSLSENARHDFITKGPRNGTPIEVKLWDAILKVLAEDSG
jgi:hypothetical protein